MTNQYRPHRPGGLVFAALLVGALTACSSGREEKKPPPPEVGYVMLRPTSAPDMTELTGRIVAFQLAEIRPQVAGIVKRRSFVEGSIVRAGQTLYQIDPSLYAAAADEARANLASAQASEQAARIRAERYRPLAQAEAVSQQEFTDVQATARQANAAVAQNRARLATAQVNLRFTRVPAPITGRIGRSLVTEGALVTTNQTQPLAVIQQLDPVHVDIQQSSAALLRLRRQLASGGAMPASAEVRLKLEDGSDYPLPGRIGFSETLVDPATGSVTLRATFRNPEGTLLPGMFVRARFAQAVSTDVFLVPQQAVARDPTGGATVYVVGKDGKPALRKVVATRTQGPNWVVTEGLRAGDKVIVQGVQRVRPGQPVRAVPATAAQRIAPPQRPAG